MHKNWNELNTERYYKFINSIINTRGQWNIPEGIYYEKHHIIPKSLEGSNDLVNIIYLLPEEHYMAHKLLALDNLTNSSLLHAWNMMSRVNDKEITAEEYAVLREAYHNVIVGAPLSDKAKNNMSISRLKYYEDQANRDKVSEYMKAYAATISEEERKMKYNTRGRKVRCVETNEIFNTVTEAQKAKHCSVLSALKGVYETSGGYHWEYLDNKNYDYSKRYKKVRCIETGEVFESILEANKKYKGKIGGCCRGQRKTAAGYHWEYVE